MAWKLNSKFQFQIKSETFMKKTKTSQNLLSSVIPIVLRFSFALILLGSLGINFHNLQLLINLTWLLLPCKIKQSHSNFWGSLSSYNKNMLYFDRVLAYLPGTLDINLVKISIKIGLSKIRCMSWPENHTRNFNFKLNEKHLWKTKNFTKPFGQAWHQIVLRFSFSLILLGALEINFENFDRFQLFINLTFWLSSYLVKLNPIFKKLLVIPISERSFSSYNTCQIYFILIEFDHLLPGALCHKFGHDISIKIGLSKIRCMSWPENHTRNFNFKLNEKHLWKKTTSQNFWTSVTPIFYSIIQFWWVRLNFDRFLFINLTFGLST